MSIRSSRKDRPTSEEIRADMRRLHAQGLTIKVMAERLRLSRSIVARHIKALGLTANRAMRVRSR